MLKSCGCSYGMCCCGPTKTNKEKMEDELLDEMVKFVKPHQFTAVYKDLVYDKRKNVIHTADYINLKHWKEAFVRWVNEPCPNKVIEMGHKLHDRFKYEEYYTPRLLSKTLDRLIWSGTFSTEDKEGINTYFKHLFEYQETRSEWEQ